MVTTAAYGTWASPVTPELLSHSTVGLAAVSLDGTDLYWLEARSDQGGRVSLWRRPDSGALVEVTAEPFNVRSRVHEYGGGEYAVDAGIVVFSNFADGRLYRVGPAGDPEPITPATEPPSALRFGDLRLDAANGLVLAVREDHRDGGEPVNSVVALDLDSDNDDGGRVLCAGADFYADPALSRDGRLAWTQWDHPAMPWDATSVHVGRLAADGVVDVIVVAGGPDESAIHPTWLPDGRLLVSSDRSGFWAPYAWDGSELRALWPQGDDPVDHDGPPWQLGQRPYAVVDDRRLACLAVRDGRNSVELLDLATGAVTEVAAAVGTSLAAAEGLLATVLTPPERPAEVAVLDLDGGAWTTVRAAADPVLDADAVSVGEAVWWTTDAGEPVHAWYYAPTHPAYAAPDGERPPLIVHSHGGPTALAQPALKLGYQFWTSRGIAVLDVNYGGSAGFGRAYRERLRGRWGLVDVADCIGGACAMVEQGRADPARLVITGGSAGGYTTLRTLTVTDEFAAGISLYGVADLAALARDTHKFESRYLDGLVGPYPERADVYAERSPITHVDDLASPLLLLQGTEDAVVPPNQAEAMAAAVRAKGLPVELVLFEGEGHGFRRADSIVTAYAAQLAFLGEVLGFVPSEDAPSVRNSAP